MADFNQAVQWPSPAGELFDRAQTFSTTPGHNGWTFAADAAATCVTIDGGGVLLANAGAADNGCLFQNNRLAFDIDEIQSIEMIAKVAGISATSTLVFGLGSARDDDPDLVTASAWFRMEGSASLVNIVAESDDTVTDRNDIATGQTLGSTLRRFAIDFTRIGGKRAVAFTIDEFRVAAATTFTFDGYPGKVQPIFQLQQTGAGTPSITIAKMQIITSRSYA
jgi:hypothetical protein